MRSRSSGRGSLALPLRSLREVVPNVRARRRWSASSIALVLALRMSMSRNIATAVVKCSRARTGVSAGL
jgi:hypothetical protein